MLALCLGFIAIPSGMNSTLLYASVPLILSVFVLGLGTYLAVKKLPYAYHFIIFGLMWVCGLLFLMFAINSQGQPRFAWMDWLLMSIIANLFMVAIPQLIAFYETMSLKKAIWTTVHTLAFGLGTYFWKPEDNLTMYFMWGLIPLLAFILIHQKWNIIKNIPALKKPMPLTWEGTKNSIFTLNALLWSISFIAGLASSIWIANAVDGTDFYKSNLQEWYVYWGFFLGSIVVATAFVRFIFAMIEWTFYEVATHRLENKQKQEESPQPAAEPKAKRSWSFSFGSFINLDSIQVSMFVLVILGTNFLHPMILWFYIPVHCAFWIIRDYVSIPTADNQQPEVLTGRKVDVWSRRATIFLLVWSVIGAPIAYIWFALKRQTRWAAVTAWLVLILGTPIGYMALDSHTNGKINQVSMLSFTGHAMLSKYKAVQWTFIPHYHTVKFIGEKWSSRMIRWKPLSILPTGKTMWAGLTNWRKSKPGKRKKQQLVVDLGTKRKKTIRRRPAPRRIFVPAVAPAPRRDDIRPQPVPRVEPPVVTPRPRPRPVVVPRPEPKVYHCKKPQLGHPGTALKTDAHNWTKEAARKFALRYRTLLPRAFKQADFLSEKASSSVAITPYFLFKIDGSAYYVFKDKKSGPVAFLKQDNLKAKSGLATPVVMVSRPQTSPCK